MFSSTIKPYKFVNPSSITVKGGATIIAGGKTITGGASPQVKSARVTMLAINRIGMAMVGLGKTQQQIRDIIVSENGFLSESSKLKKKVDGYRRDQRSEDQSESFGKKEGDSVSKEVVKKEKKRIGWLEKIFGPFAGIISFVGKFVIQQTVLRWMADPNNTKKLVVFVKSFSKVFKWAFTIAYKSTDAVLSGFAKVFGSSDKKGLNRFGEVLGGLGQLIIGIAGFKALGYLLKPWTLVSDILGLVDALNFGGDSGDLPDGPNSKPGGKPNRTPAQLKEAQKRYFNKFGRDAFIKRFGEEGLKNLPRNMQRSALRQFGRNAKAFGIKTTQKVLGKGVSKALGKIPIIGPVIDFAIRTLIFRESLGKAAASAVGAAIGQGIGGAIGTVGAGALAGGTFGVGLAAAPIIIGASSLIGGFLGDYVGSKLYDWIAPFFSKDKTPQMAKGGIVDRPTRAIIGEKGPEAVIPLSNLGMGGSMGGVASTLIGATESALSRMGAAGVIARALIGGDLADAANIFGATGIGTSGGDTLGKSVSKGLSGKLFQVDAGDDISVLVGDGNVSITDRKDPSNKPTTLRGQLANILGALIWVSKKDIKRGRGSGGPGSRKPGPGGGGMLPGDAPPIIKAMLDAIAAAEGGWDSVNPGTTVPGLSNMTIADARRAAMSKGYGMGGSGAMGKWQQMPEFILGRAKSAGLDPNKDIFNQENQTKIARMLMAGVYPGGEKQLVVDAQENPLKAAANLRGTWPSLPGGSQENSHSKNFVSHFNANVSKYSKAAAGGSINGKGKLLVPTSPNLSATSVLDKIYPNRVETQSGMEKKPRGLADQLVSTYGWKDFAAHKSEGMSNISSSILPSMEKFNKKELGAKPTKKLIPKPAIQPNQPKTPSKPSISATHSANSSGSNMSKISDKIESLEEAAKATENSGQIVPLPINTSVTTSAVFSGQQVYTPRSPITYGI